MVLTREFFQGTTRMHEWMRAFDWGNSAFGPPAAWSKSLCTVVELMLDSALPMCLSWGPDLRVLYNGAFLPLVEGLHPDAFAARMCDLCPDDWPGLEPVLRRALAGEHCACENFPREMARNGGVLPPMVHVLVHPRARGRRRRGRRALHQLRNDRAVADRAPPGIRVDRDRPVARPVRSRRHHSPGVPPARAAPGRGARRLLRSRGVAAVCGGAPGLDRRRAAVARGMHPDHGRLPPAGDRPPARRACPSVRRRARNRGGRCSHLRGRGGAVHAGRAPVQERSPVRGAPGRRHPHPPLDR